MESTDYTDLIIYRIRQYGAYVVIASQYGNWSRAPDEAKRLEILAEAEEVIDSLRDVIDNNPKGYTRENIDNATDIAHIQGQIKGDTPSPPTKL